MDRNGTVLIPHSTPGVIVCNNIQKNLKTSRAEVFRFICFNRHGNFLILPSTLWTIVCNNKKNNQRTSRAPQIHVFWIEIGIFSSPSPLWGRLFATRTIRIRGLHGVRSLYSHVLDRDATCPNPPPLWCRLFATRNRRI